MEADLEVGCAVDVDLAGGQDVSEALDGGGAPSLAGAGDAGGVVARIEAVRHRAVAGPALTAGGGAAVAVGGRAAAPVAAPSGRRRQRRRWRCW